MISRNFLRVKFLFFHNCFSRLHNIKSLDKSLNSYLFQYYQVCRLAYSWKYFLGIESCYFLTNIVIIFLSVRAAKIVNACFLHPFFSSKKWICICQMSNPFLTVLPTLYPFLKQILSSYSFVRASTDAI